MLVAISIPIFTAQLRKARVATDLANERAAKAAAVTQALNDEADSTKAAVERKYYYDAATGTVVEATTNGNENKQIASYGKVSDADANDGFADSTTTDHVGKIVKVTIDTDNEITIDWVDGKK